VDFSAQTLAQHAVVDRGACGISDPVKRLRFLRREMAALEAEEPAKAPAPKCRRFNPRAIASAVFVLFLVLLPGMRPSDTADTFERERRLTIPFASPPALPSPPRVWMVDHSATEETYSNGLHVDLTFAVSNRPTKRFPVFPLNGGAEVAEFGSQPAGIVYHSTESHLAPFEEDQNRLLKQLGRNLLENVRREHSYHYVIDHFGRVFLRS
jgi:hypothetical protein